MNRKKYIIIGVLTVVALVLLYFSIKNSKVEPSIADGGYSVYEVAKLDDLVFSGNVRATEMQDVYYDASLGAIEEVHVQKGQQVKIGDELITYKNEAVKAEAAAQKLSRERLNFNITNTEKEINTANKNVQEIENRLTSKKNDLNKLSSDDPDHFLMTEQLTQAIAQLENELEVHKQSLPQLQQTLAGFNFDLRELNNSIGQSEAKIVAKVTSAFEGIVSERAVNMSDPSKPVLQILSNEVIIEGIVSEYDHYRLKQQQKVTIRPNSSAETVAGEITALSLTPTVGVGSETTVNYLFTVTPEQWLQYGLSVQIFLEQTDLVIPETAIVTEDTTAYVFIYNDGKASKREIVVEEKNNQVNVTAGISAGDTIIENPDTKIKDGQEVSVNDQTT